MLIDAHVPSTSRGNRIMLTILAVTALSLQLIAPYIVWPNRWNVPTHIAAGFCITAYVIPGLFTDVWEKFPQQTVNFFIEINILGAFALCAGVYLGNFFAARPATGEIAHNKRPYSTNIFRKNSALLIKRVIIIVGPCIIGLCLAYWIMGFIPMFAEDPFSAKQFKGVYRDPYYRVAYLFRFCFSIIQASIPLLLAIGWYKRSPFLVAMAIAAFLVIFISLARGATAAGILFFLGIVAANSRNGLKWYIPLVFFIFPFGSVFYYVLGQVLQVQSLQSGYVIESFSEFVSSGAPDIWDQLTWLHGFVQGDFFSYGRTIYGGLIPGNYPWNPSVWTITYNDVGADVSELVTGGLRLTAAEWGYANFGWFGVVIVPFLSGLFNGAMLNKLKTLLPRLTVLQAASALIVYSTLGVQIVQFYFLSIHSLPAIAAALYFWRANIIKNNRNIRPSQRQFV